MSNILMRHRAAALLGAAVIVAPLSMAAFAGHDAAAAAGTGPAVAVPLASGASFAPIVSADKPAIVTITTVIKADNAGNDETSQLGENSPFDEQFRQFFRDQGIPLPDRPATAPRATGRSARLRLRRGRGWLHRHQQPRHRQGVEHHGDP